MKPSMKYLLVVAFLVLTAPQMTDAIFANLFLRTTATVGFPLCLASTTCATCLVGQTLTPDFSACSSPPLSTSIFANAQRLRCMYTAFAAAIEAVCAAECNCA